MSKKWLSFIAVIVLLPAVTLFAMVTGSIDITYTELLMNFFNENHENIGIIKDLRFPRIIIAIFAGAALSVSGVLLQAVMRNPLAEPGIIGVSAGSSFFTLLILAFYPSLFFYTPLFAFIGGMIAFFIVYSLSWKSSLHPLRMILIGVAINALFTGLGQTIGITNASSMINSVQTDMSTLTMKTWSDVNIIVIYGSIGLLLAYLLFGWCNHLSLKDKTLHNLGFPVNRARLFIAIVAVLLASIATAVAGMFTFVGLLIPHIGRNLVGTNHKLLIPFSALAGGLLILIADTLGRTLLAPIEIPASIIMAVIGGPFLIFVLRKSGKLYGN
ncbi:MAG TPA: iron ABC transporter permease [Pseudogracilibacillus sp.]|nr:iron ABC transporter permease [Pseudogracilibacillus sp.]